VEACAAVSTQSGGWGVPASAGSANPTTRDAARNEDTQ
jgi:hypothetical protein